MTGSARRRSLLSAAVAALSVAAGAGCAGAPPRRAPDPPARAAGVPAPTVPRTSAATPRVAPSPAAGAGQARAAALLVGIWRPVSAADGRDAQDHDVALEFRADGTWTIAGASYRARGAYRWVAADEIALTTIDSNLPTQVGTTSHRRVAVDASALALTATAQDGRRAREDSGVTTAYRRQGGR